MTGPLRPPRGRAAGGGARRPNRYPNYAVFWDEELRFLFQRHMDATAFWCPDWQMHTEAVARVSALWLAWEHAERQAMSDPLGAGAAEPAKWWANLADPIMRELLSPEGTFRGCSIEGGHDQKNIALGVLRAEDLE